MGRIRRKLDPARRPGVAGGGEARPGRSRHAASPSAPRRGPGARRGRWRCHGRGDVRSLSSARPALSRAARCDPRPLRRAELRRVPSSRAWRAGGRGLLLRGGGLARPATRGRGRGDGPLLDCMAVPWLMWLPWPFSTGPPASRPGRSCSALSRPDVDSPGVCCEWLAGRSGRRCSPTPPGISPSSWSGRSSSAQVGGAYSPLGIDPSKRRHAQPSPRFTSARDLSTGSRNPSGRPAPGARCRTSRPASRGP